MAVLLSINPGSGPCLNTTETNAIENIKQFIKDCEIENLVWERKPEIDYGEGRYAFIIKNERRKWEVQMPGLPLEKVRYMQEANQNIWHFPRLYVDGSSWVWCYALLHDEDEES